MFRYLLIASSLFLFLSCNTQVKSQYLSQIKIDSDHSIPKSYTNQNRIPPCGVIEDYIPDPNQMEYTPMKHIRVNFHVMNNAKGRGNFNEKQGRKFVRQVLNAANDNMNRNKPMRLPLGNSTPNLPIQYRYLLTPDPSIPGDDGIYFHNDDDLYYMMAGGPFQNNYDKKVYQKYGIQKETVMNIFVMTHPIDSMKSRKFNPNTASCGIAFGTWLKVSGWYADVKNNKDQYYCMKLLNHEIGHCLGLNHTWRGNDGCDDTPVNPNCWGETNRPPCDTKWGNNVMDYNAHASAWSPCQLGKINYNMAGHKPKLRKLLEPTWCKLQDDIPLSIEGKVHWKGSKDFKQHIVVRDFAELTIDCRVSMAKGARLIVYPQAKLILNGATLYNDCGDQWKGIQILKKGKKEGVVEILNAPLIKDAEHEVEIVLLES